MHWRREKDPAIAPYIRARADGSMATPSTFGHLGDVHRRVVSRAVSTPRVLIRDLPPEVHASLQHRAEAAGQSLQQYLTSELSLVAQSPTIAEVIERIAERSGGRVGLQTAVDDLHDERARR